MEISTAPDALKPRARKKLERDIAEAVCKNMSSDPQRTADLIIERNLINVKEIKEVLATTVSAPATLTNGVI